MLMVLFLVFKVLSFYYENTQGKQKLHREITGKTQGIPLSEMSGNHVRTSIIHLVNHLSAFSKIVSYLPMNK